MCQNCHKLQNIWLTDKLACVNNGNLHFVWSFDFKYILYINANESTSEQWSKRNPSVNNSEYDSYQGTFAFPQILIETLQSVHIHLLDLNNSKVKWCIYVAPFVYNMLKGALQWSVYPQRTGSIYIGTSGSRFKAVHVYWYSFYRSRKGGKLSEL